jgi:hypothetical protein
MHLPACFATVILTFAPVFLQQRTWRHAELLLISAILAPGKRTVTSLLRITGLSRERRFTNYHRVLNRAVWRPHVAAHLLLRLLITTFVPLDGSSPQSIQNSSAAKWSSVHPGRQDQEPRARPGRTALRLRGRKIAHAQMHMVSQPALMLLAHANPVGSIPCCRRLCRLPGPSFLTSTCRNGRRSSNGKPESLRTGADGKVTDATCSETVVAFGCRSAFLRSCQGSLLAGPGEGARGSGSTAATALRGRPRGRFAAAGGTSPSLLATLRGRPGPRRTGRASLGVGVRSLGCGCCLPGCASLAHRPQHDRTRHQLHLEPVAAAQAEFPTQTGW